MQLTSITVFLVCLLVLLGLFVDNQVDGAPALQRRAQHNTKLHAKKQLTVRRKRDLDEDEQLEEEEERIFNDDENVAQDFDKRRFEESEDSEDQEVRADDNEEGYLPVEDAEVREFDDDMDKRAVDLSDEESNSDEKRK